MAMLGLPVSHPLVLWANAMRGLSLESVSPGADLRTGVVNMLPWLGRYLEVCTWLDQWGPGSV